MLHEVDRDEFVARYSAIEREWVHMELRDFYGVPGDFEAFAQWRRGEPVDNSYLDDWHALVSRLSGEGKSLRRIKVVCEPLGEYHRFSYETIDDIVRAGEPTRWCGRDKLTALRLPATDFYVLDQRTAMFLHYDGQGVVSKRLVTEDPELVRFCRAVFEDVWPLATDHHDYRPRI
ncbi:hypothetical protein GCM10010123_44720 [Pilimelia anulata]|uniref:DUF6879 domain-containing protein n=1 Tax=Pilimelia anulata TaxID=53371 RepID=A0A8J3BBZ7_9ACTN|nr:DUF6879 family protein [Pilimelia anulata]GGK09860.1 hypothetical protein GCM10010123_44720 [Pilimelia anulata]